MERELFRKGIKYRMNDNAFLSVADPQTLQAIAECFTPELIRKQVDYWAFLLAPKFSQKEQEALNLHRRYFISQVEFCSNVIFHRHLSNSMKNLEPSYGYDLTNSKRHTIRPMHQYKIKNSFSLSIFAMSSERRNTWARIKN